MGLLSSVLGKFSSNDDLRGLRSRILNAESSESVVKSSGYEDNIEAIKALESKGKKELDNAVKEAEIIENKVEDIEEILNELSVEEAGNLDIEINVFNEKLKQGERNLAEVLERENEIDKITEDAELFFEAAEKLASVEKRAGAKHIEEKRNEAANFDNKIRSEERKVRKLEKIIEQARNELNEAYSLTDQRAEDRDLVEEQEQAVKEIAVKLHEELQKDLPS